MSSSDLYGHHGGHMEAHTVHTYVYLQSDDLHKCIKEENLYTFKINKQK